MIQTKIYQISCIGVIIDLYEHCNKIYQWIVLRRLKNVHLMKTLLKIIGHFFKSSCQIDKTFTQNAQCVTTFTGKNENWKM